MRCRTLACLAAVGLATVTFAGAAVPALAQDAADAGKLKLLEGMGRRAFNEQRWDDAIDAFQAAYLMKPEPKYLYNIGRSHEKAGRIDNAVEYLTEYVAQDIDAKDRTDAEAVLAVLRVKQQRHEAGEEPQRAESGAEVQKPEEAAPLPSSEPEPPPPEPAAAEETRLLGIGWPAVAAFGAGAAMLAGGAGFGMMASVAEARRDDLKTAGPVPASKFQAEDDAARGHALVANVLLGVGVAAVAAGVVLLLLDDADADSAGAGLRVQPGPLGVQVTWGGGLR